MITLTFEHDYRNKVLEIGFAPGSRISSVRDVAEMRQQWLDALKSWHSPYKALIDVEHLTVDPTDSSKLEQSFQSMHKVLTGLFLRKAACYGVDLAKGHEALPFSAHPSQEEASNYLGIRARKASSRTDFRSSILLENHFKQHTIELSFEAETALDSQKKWAVLKDKLLNNLMQWHSAWNLLVDCRHLRIDEEQHEHFRRLEQVLRGFFLKRVVGYNLAPNSKMPFEGFRSRHRAAAMLEAEGTFSGEDANCATRKT